MTHTQATIIIIILIGIWGNLFNINVLLKLKK